MKPAPHGPLSGFRPAAARRRRRRLVAADRPHHHQPPGGGVIGQFSRKEGFIMADDTNVSLLLGQLRLSGAGQHAQGITDTVAA